MRPVSQHRIDIASEHIENADIVAEASRAAGLGYAIACAFVKKESGGRNIYGHDHGGIFSTATGPVRIGEAVYLKGADIEVTHANFGVFLIKMACGLKSNGVGPMQITYAGELPDGRTGGFFRQMLEDQDLDPAEPFDNMLFGFRKLKEYRRGQHSWAEVGTLYNAGNLGHGVNQYGWDVVELIRFFRREFKQ